MFRQIRWVALIALLSGCATNHEDGPRLLDDRLSLHLFAEDPEIVTPIGMAIDARDRVFVLESHTHSPPEDYQGPSSDQIKVFVDEDGDGEADRSWLFAEGFEDGMNLAFSPEGVLHLVTSREVWALLDEDGDGKSENRRLILNMTQPASVYDHAGLLGLTFSDDGWLYVARGNTGSQAWRLEGTDGSYVSGYGDGGNIMRARTDGSRVEEVATGFWNPFDLKFDQAGRLLAIDNDPDSRGPNRLLHIVPGGNYGYQSLYGGSGIHPYLAWNGELPGTLPYAAPLGEAPSGLLDAASAGLPADYQTGVLATIWEERTIVWVPLEEDGATVKGGEQKILMEGPANFHPVALATDSKGHIYVTDWMIRRYPNHAKGRLWRISSDALVHQVASNPAPNKEHAAWQEALGSSAAFERHAAIMEAIRPAHRNELIAMRRHPDAAIRMGVLLALKRLADEDAAPWVREFLSDQDPEIRRMAFVWAGSARLAELEAEIHQVAKRPDLTAEQFEAYLAAVRHLQPAFINALDSQAADRSNAIPRELPAGLLASIAFNEVLQPSVRQLALRSLEPREANRSLLESLALNGPTLALRGQAVRTLGRLPDASSFLAELALDSDEPAALRVAALGKLQASSALPTSSLLPMLSDDTSAVQQAAARILRLRQLSDEERLAIQELAAQATDPALLEQLGFLVETVLPDRPAGRDAWRSALATGGDALAGKDVFFSLQAQCAICHAYEQEGGTIGPALDRVGASKSRQQIIDSILDPSAEIAPQWQGWYVETSDGSRYTGRQIDVGLQSVELMNESGEFVRYEDVASFGVLESSLMPAGLEHQLTVHDLRNLVAFLAESK